MNILSCALSHTHTLAHTVLFVSISFWHVIVLHNHPCVCVCVCVAVLLSMETDFYWHHCANWFGASVYQEKRTRSGHSTLPTCTHRFHKHVWLKHISHSCAIWSPGSGTLLMFSLVFELPNTVWVWFADLFAFRHEASSASCSGTTRTHTHTHTLVKL